MNAPVPMSRERLSRVLVPTDFSEGASAALGRALSLPLAPGARLHLVHVLPEEVPARLRVDARTHAHATLELEVAGARKHPAARQDVATSFEVLEGRAYVELIRCARREGAELIVLGRHGRRGVADALLGSTAGRVIRKGDVPVLAVRAPPAGPYRTPLVAAELEDTTLRTIALAQRVLGPEVSEVPVLHAFNVAYEGFLSPAYMPDSNAVGSFEEDASRRLEALLTPLRGQGAVALRAVVRRGEPRRVLLEEARRSGCDLLVLGTHGRAGVAHALLGSVAESMVLHAPCDVLVVRPPGFSLELP